MFMHSQTSSWLLSNIISTRTRGQLLADAYVQENTQICKYQILDKITQKCKKMLSKC